MSSNQRPQYGEYATPEEQRRAMGLPEAPAVYASSTPDASPDHTDAHRTEGGAAKHPVDRVVTFILLAFGLFTVLNSIPGYLALPEVLQGVYDSLGAGNYTAVDTAASLGVTAVVVQGVLWIATAWLAFASLKRGRLSWWIAVVGGAVNFVAVMVIVSVALFADPGFIDSLDTSRLG